MLLEAERLAPRISLDQRVLLALCGVLAVAVPLCLYLGTRGFAPVVALEGLACLPFARPSRRDWPGLLILAALVVWALVSILWSPAPNLHPHTSKDLTRLTIAHLALELVLCTGFVTAFARLRAERAERGLVWIAGGVLAIQLVILADGLCGAALYQRLTELVHEHARPDLAVRAIAQGGYGSAVILWPLAMTLHRRGRPYLAWAMAAFVPLSLIVTRGFAPTAALVVSLPLYYLAKRYGRPVVLALAAITAVYMLSTPLIMGAVAHWGVYDRVKDLLPPSWADRVRIWSFIADRLGEHPLRGAGLDASRVYPGVVPLHPHNAALQLWFELGAPGALLATAFWIWLWRRIADCADRDRLYGAVASATAIVYLIIGGVGFGVWQEWWLCVGALAMALSILFSKTIAPAA